MAKKLPLIIGIDIGSSMIRAVATKKIPEHYFPEVVSSCELPVEGVERGNIIDKVEVADICANLINDIEESLGQKAAHVIVSLGGAQLSSSQVSGITRIARGDAVVSSIDIETAINEGKNHIIDVRNKDVLHEIPLRYKLDGQEVTGNIIGLRGNKLEVRSMYVTYPRHLMQDVKDMLQLTKLSISDIIAGPLAESIPLLLKRERRAGVLLVNIGASTTSLVAYENNVPLLVSSLPFGGNDITKDIALGIKVTLEEAENIKHGVATIMYPKRRAEEIIEARIADMCEHINKELERIHRRELLPAGVVLTGMGSSLPKIDYMMRYELKLPIRLSAGILNQFTRGTLTDEAFARSYGLTFFANDYKETDIFLGVFKQVFHSIKKYFAQFAP